MSLSACENACIPPSWDCDGQGICISRDDGMGMFFDSTQCVSYCESISIVSEQHNFKQQVVKIINMLGQETIPIFDVPLFYFYNDGRVEKKIFKK